MVHTIAPGETLMKLSRQYNKPLSVIAKANNIPPHTQVKVGDRIVIPGVRSASADERSTKVRAACCSAGAARADGAAAAQAGRAEGRRVGPADGSRADGSRHHAGRATIRRRRRKRSTPRRPRACRRSAGRCAAASSPDFGPKPTGQQNDGINVAVPEGTPIKAAEDGVVAYAGNELKTYGNLVLVRHSNGFVTAYAHASEILVKRDEPIKRGQVIAKSGQTGNVAAPQLHFEIRKGSAPIDPMPFLDKGGG